MMSGFWICCVFGCWYEIATCGDVTLDAGCDGTAEVGCDGTCCVGACCIPDATIGREDIICCGGTIDLGCPKCTPVGMT